MSDKKEEEQEAATGSISQKSHVRKLEIDERMVDTFREKLSRIIRNADLINSCNNRTTNDGKSRFLIIKESASFIDEELKKI